MLTKFDSRPYFVPNSLFIQTRWEKIIFLDNPTPPPFEKNPQSLELTPLKIKS